jgi:hypothetical protein
MGGGKGAGGKTREQVRARGKGTGARKSPKEVVESGVRWRAAREKSEPKKKVLGSSQHPLAPRTNDARVRDIIHVTFLLIYLVF